MKHIMFGTNGANGEMSVVLINKDDSDTYPCVITWRFLDYGKPMLLVDVVNSENEMLMSSIATIDDGGDYSCEFEVVTDDNDRVELKVSYYQEIDRIFIKVTEF